MKTKKRRMRGLRWKGFNGGGERFWEEWEFKMKERVWELGDEAEWKM